MILSDKEICEKYAVELSQAIPKRQPALMFSGCLAV